MLTVSLFVQIQAVHKFNNGPTDNKKNCELQMKVRSENTWKSFQADLYACKICFTPHNHYYCTALVRNIHRVNAGLDGNVGAALERMLTLFPPSVQGEKNRQCMRVSAARYGRYPPRSPKASPTRSIKPTPLTRSPRPAQPSMSASIAATPFPTSTWTAAARPSASASATKLPLISASTSPSVGSTNMPPERLSRYLPNEPPEVNLEILRRDIQREVSALFNLPGDVIRTKASLEDSSSPNFPFDEYPPYERQRNRSDYEHPIGDVPYNESRINSLGFIEQSTRTLPLSMKKRIPNCGQSNCAAKVNVRANRFIRKDIITTAVKKVQRSSKFNRVYDRKRASVYSRGPRLYLVVLPFKGKYLKNNASK